MANPKVYVGKKIFIEVETRDTNDRVVSSAPTVFTSGTPAVATVGGQTDGGVYVTGVAAGTSTIQANNGGDIGTIDVDVLTVPGAQARKVSLRQGRGEKN